MRQKALYTEKQPNVRYKKLNDTQADVIVNEFIKEEQIIVSPEENVTQTMYEYWSNIFSVNPSVVTEIDIKNKLPYYMNYEEEKEKTLKEEIKNLKEENAFLSQCLMEMSEIVYA